MHISAWFNTALQIIQAYDNSIPLAAWLKNYFSQNKKHGSRDRRYISRFCYCFYRTGNLFNTLSETDKLTASVFLVAEYDEHLTVLFPNEWRMLFTSSVGDKLVFLQQIYSINLQQIFPLNQHLSAGLDADAFILSHLQQPDVFLRVRPGNHQRVIQQLNKEAILYQQPYSNCLQLPAGFNVQGLFTADKEVVVQDLSSQRVAELLNIIGKNKEKTLSVWDVCAGSGGKSLLAFDTLGDIKITATDVRPSIIYNLQQRFKQAGIKNYEAKVEDVSADVFNFNRKFDIVFCDVPCSGSGTWGRTPEQLSLFKKENIHRYTVLQKKIVSNAVKCLLPGAYFLYITCSVLKEENEEMCDWLGRYPSLKLVQKTLLKGYTAKANTMFAALFSFA